MDIPGLHGRSKYQSPAGIAFTLQDRAVEDVVDASVACVQGAGNDLLLASSGSGMLGLAPRR